MKADIIEPIETLNAIYTEENPSFPQEKTDIKDNKNDGSTSIYAQVHRTLMFQGSRSTSTGTWLWLWNLCF